MSVTKTQNTEAAQVKRLQALADQKSGDPHLDAMASHVVKDTVRKLLYTPE